MDKDTVEDLLEAIKGELQQVKLLLTELVEWKSEIETAMADVQSGGFLGIMGKMLAK
jgi:hypothetical protein